MEKHISILQNILKTANLLTGTPEANPIWLKAIGMALKKPGINLQPTPLQPVLATLGDKRLTTNFRFDAQKLNLTEAFFPKSDASGSIQSQFSTLKSELDKHNGDLSQMLRVLESHGSSIACHPNFPDISIFDCVKSAAGIAYCLLESGNENLRLIGASVSGIQTYLYDVISKNAAKLLKGRSFYVQLLANSLMDELLEALKIPEYNVVYASGGGFYVLAPDSADITQKVADFFSKASSAIYAKHKTNLFIEGAITAPFDEDANVDVVWDELIIALNRKKYKRLSGNPELWSSFFKPAEFGGTAQKDQITNVELDPEDAINIAEDDEAPVIVSQLTRQQINTGKELRKANYWATSKFVDFLSHREYEIIDPFGNYHWLEEKDANSNGIGRIRGINQMHNKYPTTLYGGNRVPAWDESDSSLQNGRSNDPKPKVGAPKMFDQLAQGAGLDRLGVLRMDVDNLGSILSEKAEASYGINLARYASISRSLDWFFKGFLNTLHEKYLKHTIIIYSGGDDLFIVGRWREVLGFASEIRFEFNKWVCNNPNLTISGGISIVPAKFPIMQASKLAGRAEDMAKDHGLLHDKTDITKNSFTLFGVPLHWKEEFPIVEALKDEMLPYLRERKLLNSFLTKISSHAIARHAQEPDKTEKCFKFLPFLDNRKSKDSAPRWRWTMAYDLARLRDTLRDSAARDFVNRILSDAFAGQVYSNKPITSRYHYLDLLLVASRWAELQLRTEDKSKTNTNAIN